MSERTFFVRLNLDDMGAEASSLDSTEERGQWMEGFLVGSRGHEPRDHWPRPKLDGHAFGLRCFQEAEEYREKQAAKGRASGKSRRKGTAVQPRLNRSSTTVEPQLNRTPTEPQPIQHPTSNNHKPETKSQKPSPPVSPRRGERTSPMVPPTEEEWVAYCTETWPDWHPTCSAEAWAYYTSKGWKIGSVPCRDWKATARTAHGNARQWGKLQPIQGGKPPGRAPAPSIRRTMDQEWAESNPHMLKPYQAEEDSEPAY